MISQKFNINENNLRENDGDIYILTWTDSLINKLKNNNNLSKDVINKLRDEILNEDHDTESLIQDVGDAKNSNIYNKLQNKKIFNKISSTANHTICMYI